MQIVSFFLIIFITIAYIIFYKGPDTVEGYGGRGGGHGGGRGGYGGGARGHPYYVGGGQQFEDGVQRAFEYVGGGLNYAYLNPRA